MNITINPENKLIANLLVINYSFLSITVKIEVFSHKRKISPLLKSQKQTDYQQAYY